MTMRYLKPSGSQHVGIFGPTGIGAVYGKLDVLEHKPPWRGGGNTIVDVTFEKTTYQSAAGALRPVRATLQTPQTPSTWARLSIMWIGSEWKASRPTNMNC
jgi:selenocysteine lyase/cysteine desulfurase